MSALNAVELQLFRHLLCAVPEEMGAALRRSAFSANIKERLDFSCAITNAQGALAAQASHIPVHLGSVQTTASWLQEQLELEEGDVVITNDPSGGGTHLPDITLFAPVFLGREKTASLGVLCRAHHADVGGATPGSMGRALDLFGEGLVIPPVKLVARGRPCPEVLAMILANTRTREEREGDLAAQRSAVERGRERLKALGADQGVSRLLEAVVALERHAERTTRAMLRALPDGVFKAADTLDGPGTPAIRVRLEKRGSCLLVDFAGTDPELATPFNANPAITLSALFYVVRLLVGEDLPTNAGCLKPVKLSIPQGSLLHPRRSAPVAMGNVETSQRIVDVLMQALAPCARDRMPACSQGTMNNLTMGGRLADGRPFTFYETLAGGVGGGPSRPGASALHSHMTNTLNTPVEALERAFPVIVKSYRLRRGSGGAGRHPGGEGLVREVIAEAPIVATIVGSRRRVGPPGLLGGRPGAPARDEFLGGGRSRPWPASGSVRLRPGEGLRISTPGGGGYGKQGGSAVKGSRAKKPRGRGADHG